MTSQTSTLDTENPTERRHLPRMVELARMHSVAWPLAIAAPAGILLVAFIIGWIIFFVVPNPDSETRFTGGTTSVFFFGIGFYVQAMTQTFPFALGLSISRREYYRATVATAVVQSTVFGAIIYVLSLVEAATNGWGVHMRMFGITNDLAGNPIIRLLTPVAAFLLFYSAGLLIGVVYLRWKMLGLLGLVTFGIVFFGGASIVITWQKWWPNVGDALVDAPRVVTLVIVPVVIATLLTMAGWIGLRKATA